MHSHISICCSYNSWNIFFQKLISEIRYARKTEIKPSKQRIAKVLTVCKEGVLVSVCLCICISASACSMFPHLSSGAVFFPCIAEYGNWDFLSRSQDTGFATHYLYFEIYQLWAMKLISKHKSIWDSQLWLKIIFLFLGINCRVKRSLKAFSSNMYCFYTKSKLSFPSVYKICHIFYCFLPLLQALHNV